MKKAEKYCVECGRILIMVSSERDVKYWEKMVEWKGQEMRNGFTKVGESFVRISYSSLPIAEVWIKTEEIPLKGCCGSLCPDPGCIEKVLKRKGEAKSK